MIDKENLCKHKWIHYIYTNSNGDNHIEKYPVIYINSKYVYFKRGRDEKLGMTYTSFVKVNLADVFKSDYKFLSENNRYFWINEENADGIIEAAKARFDEDRKKRWKAQAKMDLERAKKNYEHALKVYESYEEEGK